jgi:hypothetical protein
MICVGSGPGAKSRKMLAGSVWQLESVMSDRVSAYKVARDQSTSVLEV